jgi:hypothetical protein
MRKKLAAVSSLLPTEMKPEPRVDVAPRPGFSSRNTTRAPVPPDDDGRAAVTDRDLKVHANRRYGRLAPI